MAMLDVVVGDFEVFHKYFLFVAKELPDGNLVYIEDEPSLRAFYEKHKDGIWVFYNTSYDMYILRAILNGYNPKPVSDYIVAGGMGWEYEPALKGYPLNCFDAKTTVNSLKVLEGFMGEDIEESDVPFDLERELTEEEKKSVRKYCAHDVEQTYKVLCEVKPMFTAKLNLCKYFNLPRSMMNKTPARLASTILGAKRQEFGDEFDITIPSWLRIKKYAHVVQWFKDECAKAKEDIRNGGDGRFVYNDVLEVDVSGCPCVFAWGGLHGALPRYNMSKGLIFCADVASMYPSLMINEGYLSRAFTNPSLYREIYQERLELKKQHNPMANALKLVLNSTYGTLKDKTSDAYDPLMANNVCVAGQLALLDLMEHMEEIQSAVELVQCNTDGVYYCATPLSSEVFDPSSKIKLWAAPSARFRAILGEWQDRTRLKLEVTNAIQLYQRDVNNYIMELAGSDECYKGKGVFKHRTNIDCDLPIVPMAVMNHLLHGKSIRDYIYDCPHYFLFQKLYKTSSGYTAMQNGKEVKHKVNRVFASKDISKGPLCKVKDGRISRFAGCPDSCYIDNGKVKGKSIPAELDREWYVDKANELLSQVLSEGLLSMIE